MWRLTDVQYFFSFCFFFGFQFSTCVDTCCYCCLFQYVRYSKIIFNYNSHSYRLVFVIFSLLFLFIIIQFIHSFIYRLLLKGLKNSTLQFYKKKKKICFLLSWYFTTSVYWFLLKIHFLCYIWKIINYSSSLYIWLLIR